MGIVCRFVTAAGAGAAKACPCTIEEALMPGRGGTVGNAMRFR